jgi:outer membrane protein OmpA-like peptidoglycan-associated protein
MVGLALFSLAAPPAALTQAHPIPLPLPEGSVVVKTLAFTGGDRESFLSVEEVTDRGSRYSWQFQEVHATGDTIKERYGFFEATADVLAATRLLDVHAKQGPEEHPGYTMMAISRATYRRLLASRSDTFQVMTAESPGGTTPLAAGWVGGGGKVYTRYRGTLSLAASSPTSFPLLVGGRRVEVPALHLRATLTARGRRWTPELWVLADSTYPLVLKWIGASDAPENVLQTVRVDPPASHGGTGAASGQGSAMLEGVLGSACRVELPGIYFAFNSAQLEPASDPAIAALAEVLARHADWTGTIEGHTDSVGTDAANLTLSARRAAAVRARLVTVHGVNPLRLDTKGYGRSRPRETNATIEGRARNRRVELVRTCAAK